MYSTPQEPEYSLPFLGQSQGSSRSEGYELAQLKHDPPTPDFSNRRQSGSHPDAVLRTLRGWPAWVIAGHILLQIVAWSFFIVVEARGHIAVPVSVAAWITSHGLRRAIALHLNAPMPLVDFFSSVSIASRSLVLDPRKWKWSVASIALVVLTGVQTSAWTTLLTPTRIQIVAELYGTELDLASPALHQMYRSGALDFCVRNSTSLPAFAMGQTESGYMAAKSAMDFPALFTVMDATFDISTAGILPATLYPVNASVWFPSNMTLPAGIATLEDLPVGLTANFSMLQQGTSRPYEPSRKSVVGLICETGFTAMVNCSFQNLSADPTVILAGDTVRDWNHMNTSETNIIAYTELSSACSTPVDSNLNFTSAYTTGRQQNYVLMIACGPVESAGYTMIFQSAGGYDFMRTTVCTFDPFVTHVDVDYSDALVFSGIINATTREQSVLPDGDGPAGLSAMMTLGSMLFFAQGVTTNIMGDQLLPFLQEVDGNSFQDEHVLFLIEEYIRGVTEYSATVFRACLSGTNGTFPDGVPDNMTIRTNGTLFVQTVGWIHTSPITAWVLIPGTLVALFTIGVIFTAVSAHAGDAPVQTFDPANAKHLVAAATSGGLSGAFTGTSGRDLEPSERVNIALEAMPGRGAAFIRAEDGRAFT
ncbi:hypothetical protein C8R43DRAFT_1232157 [Mycena crocata]|nr:hypothetical protein C8R43DRAFT_1232157 [Mycena crocata]